MRQKEFNNRTLKNCNRKDFKKSHLKGGTSLVKEEDISIDELKELIKKVEEENRK